MGCEDIIEMFFHMQLNIKLYHWQTMSYARHKATDDLLTNLSDLIDQFIEVYIGRYKRPDFEGGFSVDIEELSDENAKQLIENYIGAMKTRVPKYLKKESDTDLLNIRDEILSNLNKTLYLFTLN
jgi:hypothetical protein